MCSCEHVCFMCVRICIERKIHTINISKKTASWLAVSGGVVDMCITWRTVNLSVLHTAQHSTAIECDVCGNCHCAAIVLAVFYHIFRFVFVTFVFVWCAWWSCLHIRFAFTWWKIFTTTSPSTVSTSKKIRIIHWFAVSVRLQKDLLLSASHRIHTQTHTYVSIRVEKYAYFAIFQVRLCVIRLFFWTCAQQSHLTVCQCFAVLDYTPYSHDKHVFCFCLNQCAGIEYICMLYAQCFCIWEEEEEGISLPIYLALFICRICFSLIFLLHYTHA